MLIKRGDAKIVEIISDSDVDQEKMQEVLKSALQEAKNLNKDGNKLESDRDSEDIKN